jgi:hypothetical protein
LRRTLVAAIFGLFVLIAIYQFTVAGTVALEMQYGPLYAHLLVGLLYSTLALIAVVVLWAMRPRRIETRTPALSEPRQMQLVMLVEAVMLGYALARKSGRAR